MKPVVEQDPRDQAAFYDDLAPSYDELLTATPIDRWTRRAFQALVSETVPPQSLVLDFGCGTGIDAGWYARCGHRVLAYDISAGMIGQLRRRCAAEIQSGQIVPLHAPFEEFPMALAPYRPAAVTANYGILNALERPRVFFEAIMPLLSPGAPVVMSILNPFYWKDHVHRVYSALRRRVPGRAPVAVAPPRIRTYRHHIAAVRSEAHPQFRFTGQASVGALVRRYQRPLDWELPQTLAQRIERRWWKSFPLRSCGMFVFLTFQRM